MNGRMESELKTEKRIEEILEIMPGHVTTWYFNMKASGMTAQTRYRYVSIIRLYLYSINDDIKNISLSDLNEDNVSQFYISIHTKTKDNVEVRTSGSYRYTVWMALNNYFSFLVKRNMVSTNYIQFINKPKLDDLDRINENRVRLDKNDFSRILLAIESNRNDIVKRRDRAIIALFMNTGVRATALTNIMLQDIDLKNKKLVVIDKGDKRQLYQLSDKMVSIINDWLTVRQSYLNDKNTMYLFLSRNGNKICSTSLDNIVEKYTKRAIGKPLSPHKLRAGFCSILYDDTHDIEFVRRAVGHASSTTTQRYIVTKGDERKKAAEIMSDIF